MKSGEIRLEDLFGKTVRNEYGRAIGRIQEARVEPDGEDYVVTHFLLGPLRRRRRLMGFFGELPTLRALGLGHERDLRPLPWHWFDLSNPERPLLTETKPSKSHGK
jgi:sporulation protein YlmC with PRC-barrel domain